MSDNVGGVGEMCDGGDEVMMLDQADEELLDMHDMDMIDLSEETEWFFEGMWLGMIQLFDTAFPSLIVGDPMVSEDDDGTLEFWVRLDCGAGVLWLCLMRLSMEHWSWKDELVN